MPPNSSTQPVKRRRLTGVLSPKSGLGANVVRTSVHVGTLAGESDLALKQAPNVIEVIATHAIPQHPYPYAQPTQSYGRSSAFVVRDALGNTRLLCTHHGVQHASCVQVKRRDQDQRYDATVLVHGYECDLALLAVEERNFWKGLTAVQFCMEFPQLLTPVTVLGFSEGGSNLCTTQGVVSRIDVFPYSGFVQLPVIQIDAAINCGSSGGPALCGGQAVGMAFSGLDDAQNVGYLVPSKVIARFLRDFESRGRYTQFCFPPFCWQSLETQDARKFFGVEGRNCGVRIEIVHTSAEGKLKKDDIVLAIDGHAIGHEAKVPLGNGHETRVSLWLLFFEKLTGETCTIRIRRGSRERNVKLKLRPYRPVIPEDPYCINSLDYLIVGGLVFQHISAMYLDTVDPYSVTGLRKELGKVSKWVEEEVTGKGIIVLGDILQHPVNVGVAYYTLLTTFNKCKFNSLRDLAAAVDKCKDSWMRFSFSNGCTCVMGTKHARAANKELLVRFGLQVDRRLNR